MEETLESVSIIGRKRGDLALHFGNVRRGINLAACAELNAVLRIESDELDLVAQARADSAEYFIEDSWIEKKCRSEIETITLGLDRGGAAADKWQSLKDAHSRAGSRH